MSDRETTAPEPAFSELLAQAPPLDAVETSEGPVALAPPPVEEPTADHAAEREEPETPDESEGVEESQSKLWAGKYKSALELERGYAELQALADRLGHEKGDLIDELAGRYYESEPGTVDWETLVEEDPATAVGYAHEVGDADALREAFESWSEVDPSAANLWYTDRIIEEKFAAMQAQQYAQPQYQAPHYLEAEPSPIGDVDLESLFPGLRELSGEMMQVASKNPMLAQSLNATDPAGRITEIGRLYNAAVAQRGQVQGDTVRQMARATAEAAHEARQNAFVVSQSTATQSTKPEANPERDFIEQLREAEARRNGWSRVDGSPLRDPAGSARARNTSGKAA